MTSADAMPSAGHRSTGRDSRQDPGERAPLTTRQVYGRWLVILAVLNSAVSMYYYLRVIGVMYRSEPTQDLRAAGPSPACGVALALSAAATIVLGVFPAAALDVAVSSVRALIS